jgi:DMSO/TMAO reductase YedYZ heme-binding membrane subunit
MKSINIAKTIAIFGLIYFIVYNTIFGWNEQPINEAEKVCDTIHNIIWAIAMVFYLYPMFGLYEHKVAEFEKEKSNP